MTILTYSKKEENSQVHLEPQNASTDASTDASPHEAGQILHLKRLLVTVKQHYEKSLHQQQIQLQFEQSQHLATQKELEKLQFQLSEKQHFYEEELEALKRQQVTLREILKKTQDELNQLRNSSPCANEQNELGQSLSEEELLSLRSQIEKARLEADQLRQNLNEALEKGHLQEQELLKTQDKSQKEIVELQQQLEDQRMQGDELETMVSPSSSHYLRRELDMIKRMLVEDVKETKALESRYIEVLNEKIELDHVTKQLQQQLTNQSSNLTSFQERMHDLEERKKSLELLLQAKEAEWIESCQERQELHIRIENLNTMAKEKEFIQDKYEQLKEEFKQISEHLEEALEGRVQVDEHLNQLEAIAANQETQLQEFAEQMQVLHQEKETLQSEQEQLKILLEESEARLKVSQQHLAKKVKEVALLGEKLEEEQAHITDFIQTVEEQKMQIAQLQASIDLYQRQEKRLQDQLHEALKGNESQIVKWEEKYFHMYEKWQESENRVRELKKIEEKHLQMQSLFANLGNFMGGTFNPSPVSYQVGQDVEESPVRPFSFENSLGEEPIFEKSQLDSQEEKFNLFGMRHPQHNE